MTLTDVTSPSTRPNRAAEVAEGVEVTAVAAREVVEAMVVAADMAEAAVREVAEEAMVAAAVDMVVAAVREAEEAMEVAVIEAMETAAAAAIPAGVGVMTETGGIELLSNFIHGHCFNVPPFGLLGGIALMLKGYTVIRLGV